MLLGAGEGEESGAEERNAVQLCLADVHQSEYSAWKGLRSASPLHELPSLPRAGGPRFVDLLVLPYQHIQVLHEKNGSERGRASFGLFCLQAQYQHTCGPRGDWC